jgi:hypothetical protein
MGEVIDFPGGDGTFSEVPVHRVLELAIEKNLNMVITLGYLEDGTEFFASSTGDARKLIWLMERAKKVLLETAVSKVHED